MPDTAARTDAINVQEIMEQIRARVREKRGIDAPDAPPEAAVRALARAEPDELLARLRDTRPGPFPVDAPTYVFEDYTLFESHRGPLKFIRRLLHPILKLFFNPNPLIQALNTQARINALAAERERARERARAAFEQAQYDALHALIIETTRLGTEMKRLAMHVESLASRVEFNEKRTRAIESASVYRASTDDRIEGPREPRREEPPPPARELREAPPQPSVPPPQTAAQPGTPGPATSDGAPRGRRRRRRRGRRGGAGNQPQGAAPPGAVPGTVAADAANAPGDDGPSALGAGDNGVNDDEGDWDTGESANAAGERGSAEHDGRDQAGPEPSDQDQ
jgi:hypothetical protein